MVSLKFRKPCTPSFSLSLLTSFSSIVAHFGFLTPMTLIESLQSGASVFNPRQIRCYVRFQFPNWSLTSVKMIEEVWLSCLTHVLSTETEEIVGLFIGDIEVFFFFFFIIIKLHLFNSCVS